MIKSHRILVDRRGYKNPHRSTLLLNLVSLLEGDAIWRTNSTTASSAKEPSTNAARSVRLGLDYPDF